MPFFIIFDLTLVVSVFKSLGFQFFIFSPCMVIFPLFCLFFFFPHTISTHLLLIHLRAKPQALQEEVLSREKEVDRLEALGQSLSPLSCAADRDWLSERVGAVRSGHTGLRNWYARRAAMLEQALANAQLFGEEEVEVLNWLAEVAQRLAEVSVQSYQPELLAEQHKYTLVGQRRHFKDAVALVPLRFYYISKKGCGLFTCNILKSKLQDY